MEPLIIPSINPFLFDFLLAEYPKLKKIIMLIIIINNFDNEELRPIRLKKLMIKASNNSIKVKMPILLKYIRYLLIIITLINNMK